MIKLTLSNFRCHTNREFELSATDTGIVLIQGASGQGKSTIADAIVFALYGSSAVKKVKSFGARSSKVTLSWPDKITIIRTQVPNRLVVSLPGNDSDIEGDPAQACINDIFGQWIEFQLGSYLRQKTANGFFTMTPADQWKLISKMTFDDIDVTKLKQQVQESIRAAEKSVIEAEATHQLLSDQYHMSISSLPSTDYSIEHETVESLNIIINKLRERKESLTSKKLAAEKFKMARSQFELLENQIKQLDSAIDIADGEYVEIRDQIGKYESYMSKFSEFAHIYTLFASTRETLMKTVNDHQQKMLEAKTTHKFIRDNHDQTLSQLKSHPLWKSYKFESITDVQQKIENAYRDRSKIQTRLDEIQKYIWVKKQVDTINTQIISLTQTVSDKEDTLNKLMINIKDAESSAKLADDFMRFFDYADQRRTQLLRLHKERADSSRRITEFTEFIEQFTSIDKIDEFISIQQEYCSLYSMRKKIITEICEFVASHTALQDNIHVYADMDICSVIESVHLLISETQHLLDRNCTSALECPSCSAQLSLSENKLEIRPTDATYLTDADISKYTQTINIANKLVTMLTTAKDITDKIPMADTYILTAAEITKLSNYNFERTRVSREYQHATWIYSEKSKWTDAEIQTHIAPFEYSPEDIIDHNIWKNITDEYRHYQKIQEQHRSDNARVIDITKGIEMAHVELTKLNNQIRQLESQLSPRMNMFNAISDIDNEMALCKQKHSDIERTLIPFLLEYKDFIELSDKLSVTDNNVKALMHQYDNLTNMEWTASDAELLGRNGYKYNPRDLLDSDVWNSITATRDELQKITHLHSLCTTREDAIGSKLRVLIDEHTRLLDQQDELSTQYRGIDEKTLEEMDTVLTRYSSEYEEIEHRKLPYFTAATDAISRKNAVDNYLIKLQEYRARLSTATTLKKIIIDVERECLHDRANTINTMVNTYLEDMFDEPLSIRISVSPVEETDRKKTKTSMTGLSSVVTELVYHGEYMPFSALSGGEQDRVSLAMTLAMAQIYNSKCLILDECLSSLDSTTCDDILFKLQERLSTNTLVFVISHQANTGLFDSVVEVSR